MEEPPTPPPVSPAGKSTAGGPKWPKTIGIICTILGGLGVLNTLFQFLNVFMLRVQMMNLVDMGADKKEVEDFLSLYGSYHAIFATIFAILAVLLLLGGISLLKRKKIASILLQIWSVGKAVAGIIGGLKLAVLMKKQMLIMMPATAPDLHGDNLNMYSKMMGMVGYLSGASMMIWAVLLPIFLLIWFNKAKVKAEIRTW